MRISSSPSPTRLSLKDLEHRFGVNNPNLGLAWKDVVAFAGDIQRAGGVAYLVGGAVRDLLLEIAPTDIDLEIHQLDPTELERLAAKLGVVSSVGRSFGVLKVRIHGQEVDLSLPRRETKIGAGHRDFSIGIDANMDVPTAARRRDFTIGAIYLQVVTGELLDPYGGIPDLTSQTLRLIDPQGFIEDPLRLLRGMQFAARFGLTVEPTTLAAMREIVPSMGALSPDRVRDEWKKIILAQTPSRGLELGRTSGYIEQWQPELAALWATPQDPKIHPEGNVWNHTLLALDRLVTIAKQHSFSQAQRLHLALAILTHDFGKPSTTRNVEGLLRADGHEEAGVAPAKTFMSRLGFGPSVIDHVASLIKTHGRLDQIFRFAQQGQPLSAGELRRLVRALHPATLDELITITTADQLGRGPFPRPDGLMAMPEHYDGSDWWAKTIAAEKLDEPFVPILSGRDLIERGWTAGPHIGTVVHLADQLGLNGMSRTEVLDILATVKTPDEAAATLQALVQSETR